MPVGGGSWVHSVGVKGLKKKEGDCNSFPLTHVFSVTMKLLQQCVHLIGQIKGAIEFIRRKQSVDNPSDRKWQLRPKWRFEFFWRMFDFDRLSASYLGA